MEFLLIARDGSDPESEERRLAAREAHRKMGYEMIRNGTLLFSTGILDDDGKPIGSCRVMKFPDRAAVDAWLEIEPYVQNNVWQHITIEPCRMGPAFDWITMEPAIRLTPDEGGDES